MIKTNKFNDKDFQQVCTSVGTLQNNHENKSVEQKHSKREHHILFWIKMATHLWILTIRSCIVKISDRLF